MSLKPVASSVLINTVSINKLAILIVQPSFIFESILRVKAKRVMLLRAPL